MRRSGVGSVKSLDGVCSRPGALEYQRKMRKVSIEVVGMSMQVLRGKGEIFAGGREGFVQGRFGSPTSFNWERRGGDGVGSHPTS